MGGGVTIENNRRNPVLKFPMLQKHADWTTVLCSRTRIFQLFRPKNQPAQLSQYRDHDIKKKYSSLLDMDLITSMLDVVDRRGAYQAMGVRNVFRPPFHESRYNIAVHKMSHHHLYQFFIQLHSSEQRAQATG